MTRKKSSPIWTINKQKMQIILDESSSFVEVLQKLGLDAHSGNHRTLNQRIKIDSLSIIELSKKRKEKQSGIKTKMPLSTIMVKDSTYGTNHLKKRIIKENLMKYVCDKCGNNGSWMGEKLVLQLEHKNGNSRDHRIENVCFLCPNCHTQTETYAGKNSNSKKNRICIECKMQTKGKGLKCRKCSSQKKEQKFFVSKEELEKLVREHPMTALGKKFKVADNSIRKRCKKLGIEIPKHGRGYWAKLRAGSR